MWKHEYIHQLFRPPGIQFRTVTLKCVFWRLCVQPLTERCDVLAGKALDKGKAWVCWVYKLEKGVGCSFPGSLSLYVSIPSSANRSCALHSFHFHVHIHLAAVYLVWFCIYPTENEQSDMNIWKVPQPEFSIIVAGKDCLKPLECWNSLIPWRVILGIFRYVHKST